jgi:hypothetical protein
MPALRVPETFSFESGPVVSSRGGLTVWFTMILLLGAMVGGGWLARRLTRDDVAMLTAASTSAVRLPVGSANDGRTGARPALPTTVPLPPPTSEAPPAAPTPPSPPPAATEAEARPTPTGPGTATKASAPIPERDLPPREESGGAGVAKGGGKTGAAAQPRKAKAGGKHAKHAKSSKKRASKKGGTGRR